MATIICKTQFVNFQNELIYVWTEKDFKENNPSFIVKAGNNNNDYALTISPYGIGTTLEEMAKIVNGCFDNESNLFVTLRNNLGWLVNEREIYLDYNKVTLKVFWARKNVDDIIKRWKEKEILLHRGKYYIIEVKPKKSRKKRGDIYSVLANSSEIEAIYNIRSRFPGAEITYIGVYNKQNNTLFIENADEIVDLTKMIKIED